MPSKVRLGIAGGAVLFAAAVWLFSRTPPAEVARVEPPSRALAAALGTGWTRVASVEKPALDPTLAPVAGGLEAKGLFLGDDGGVRVRARKAELAQRLAAVELIGGASLARGAPAPPAYENEGLRARARWAGYFEGVDLEYVYDGHQVEELLHLAPALKARAKDGLRFTSLIAGLSAESASIEPAGDALILATGPDRFRLAPAVAIDGAGKRLTLARAHRFTARGLEIDADLPGAWLREAEGDVVVDPTILDVTSQLSLQGNGVGIGWVAPTSATQPLSADWQNRAIVRDTGGRYHAVFQKGFPDANGTFRYMAMYTASDDGTSWDEPTRIADITGDNVVSEHDAPTLAVDSRGRLHAVWRDFSSVSSAARGTTNVPTTRLHYAQCPNRCAAKQWSWGGTAGGRLLFTGTSPPPVRHQQVPAIAVDASDRVWIAWREYEAAPGAAPSADAFRWGWVDGSATGDPNVFRTTSPNAGSPALPALPAPTSYDELGLIADNANVLHVFVTNNVATGSPPVNNLLHSTYSVASNTWTAQTALNTNAAASANLINYQASGSNVTAYAHGLWLAVDRAGDIHVATSRLNSTGGVWSPYYARVSSAGAWQEWGVVASPATHIVTDSAQLIVDESSPYRVHYFYSVLLSGAQYRLYGTSKNVGVASGFAAPALYFGPSTAGTRSEAEISVFSRLVYPAGAMDSIASGQVSFLVREVDSTAAGLDYYETLRFVSRGVADSPTITLPSDHGWVSTSQPILQWDRVPSDDGLAGSAYPIYVVEISRAPDMLDRGQYTAGRGTSFGFSATNALADGFHYWRVLAITQNGIGFSPVFELAVEANGPSAPQLVAPAEGADPGTRAPTFGWRDCAPGEHVEGSACVSDTRACTGGVQTWINGTGWSACAPCGPGQHLEGSACRADVRTCGVSNGTGYTQLWDGTGYGPCWIVGCNRGFHVESNACLSDTRACSIANGTGAETWTGAGYGPCTATSCATGYFNIGGLCLQPPYTLPCTGTPQTFTVPAGVYAISVDLAGAQGGDGTPGFQQNPVVNFARGGMGGRVVADLEVTPGQVLQFNVGCAGTTGGSGAGGFGGGGSSSLGSVGTNYPGGGGGGASDIRVSPFALANRVIVAGGGGGGGGAYGFQSRPGGAGGNPSGTAGASSPCGTAGGGGGGTQTAGGAGGPATCGWNVAGGAGALGAGGNGSGTSSAQGQVGGGTQGGGGGGGGGGYYGGGGGGGDGVGNGGAQGGGGGSSWAGPGTSNVVFTSGFQGGGGRVILSWRCPWADCPGGCGDTQATAGRSCSTIHGTCPAVTSSTRWVDPNGGDTADAFQVSCDMSTLDGGWTLCANAVGRLAVNFASTPSTGTATNYNFCALVAEHGATPKMVKYNDTTPSLLLSHVGPHNSGTGRLWSNGAQELKSDYTGCSGTWFTPWVATSVVPLSAVPFNNGGQCNSNPVYFTMQRVTGSCFSQAYPLAYQGACNSDFNWKDNFTWQVYTR